MYKTFSSAAGAADPPVRENAARSPIAARRALNRLQDIGLSVPSQTPRDGPADGAAKPAAGWVTGSHNNHARVLRRTRKDPRPGARTLGRTCRDARIRRA